MCVIVDTNTFSPVFNVKDQKHPEFKPVMDWILHGKGILVVGGTKYMAELKKSSHYLRLILMIKKFTNKVLHVDDKEVDAQQKTIEKSIQNRDFDDPHLPALVIVSRCQLICSCDDRSVKFVTNSTLYPKGIITPRYYMGIRNKDLLCDKYIDSRYKPLTKTSKKEAKSLEEQLNSIINGSSKF